MNPSLIDELKAEVAETEKLLGPLPDGFSLTTVTRSDENLFGVSFGIILDLCRKQKSYESLIAFVNRSEAQQKFEQLWIVRHWDGSDRIWSDVSAVVPRAEAERIWNENTGNGSRNTKYDDIDYYKLYPATKPRKHT